MKKICLSKTLDYYNASFILKWTCLSRKIKRMIYRMVSGCVFPKCLEPTPSFTLSLGQCCTAKAFLVMTFLFVNFPQTLLSFICPFTLRQLHCNTALQQLLQNSIFWIQISLNWEACIRVFTTKRTLLIVFVAPNHHDDASLSFPPGFILLHFFTWYIVLQAEFVCLFVCLIVHHIGKLLVDHKLGDYCCCCQKQIDSHVTATRLF